MVLMKEPLEKWFLDYSKEPYTDICWLLPAMPGPQSRNLPPLVYKLERIKSVIWQRGGNEDGIKETILTIFAGYATQFGR